MRRGQISVKHHLISGNKGGAGRGSEQQDYVPMRFMGVHGSSWRAWGGL